MKSKGCKMPYKLMYELMTETGLEGDTADG